MANSIPLKNIEEQDSQNQAKIKQLAKAINFLPDIEE